MLVIPALHVLIKFQEFAIDHFEQRCATMKDLNDQRLLLCQVKWQLILTWDFIHHQSLQITVAYQGTSFRQDLVCQLGQRLTHRRGIDWHYCFLKIFLQSLITWHLWNVRWLMNLQVLFLHFDTNLIKNLLSQAFKMNWMLFCL